MAVSRSKLHVSTIPPGISFVDALAAGLLADHGGDPLALCRVTVLLPTRRAVRSLREAFLRLGGGKPMLLPVMRPIGDVDEDDFAFGDSVLDTVAGALELPSAVPEIERQLLLAELIRKRDEASALGPAQAVRLAAELATLIDQVQTARLTFDHLEDLVEGDLAAHWQQTVQFLSIVTENWPAILADRGLIDPAARRNLLLQALATQWAATPPDAPVVAAGSTGSIPATADLLAVIGAMPQGQVVLPGLDRDLDVRSWRSLDEAHPQYGLAQLLDRLEIVREDVSDWRGVSDFSHSTSERARLISEVMRPEATAEAWQNLAHIEAPAIEGVRVVSCADPQAEAGVIALMLRQVLEEPGRTAALVTADRALARRVRAELARWNIEIDDSAGRPLSDSVPGIFLRLVLKVLDESVAPVPLLALLKHPLAAGGLATAAFRAQARRLEQVALRGPRPAPGFGGLERVLADSDRADTDLVNWLESLAAAAAPLAHALCRETIRITDLVEAHITFAEHLAADDTRPGAARLWAGDAGTAGAGLMADLAETAEGLAPIAGADYPSLLDSLLERVTVRPDYGTHPRLAIWGPLEARLQQADLLVLGGLNEGSWPAEAAADPWLSRPMRAAFGLPSPERMIGLAAHDFAQALASPNVVVTRAEKVDGTPTVPSRWLTRLRAVLEGAGLDDAIGGGTQWPLWQAALDMPDTTPAPVSPPEPRPPIEARPRKLSVTRVERWMRDPYSIYAQYVLGLKALDPIDAPVTVANYGSYIHQTLDRFVVDHQGPLPVDAHARLIETGRAIFAPVTAHPSLWAFWWPRFERIANWFIGVERARRADGLTSITECRGQLVLDAPGGDFTLTAIADRIDTAPGGGLEIIDYKTGAIPRDAEVVAGFSPQLPLEAAIAGAGGFSDMAPGPIEALSFWRLTGRGDGGEVHTVGHPAEQLAADALVGLGELVAAFDDPKTPYPAVPAAAEAPRYSDYAHLARVGEWSTAGEGSE